MKHRYQLFVDSDGRLFCLDFCKFVRNPPRYDRVLNALVRKDEYMHVGERNSLNMPPGYAQYLFLSPAGESFWYDPNRPAVLIDM